MTCAYVSDLGGIACAIDYEHSHCAQCGNSVVDATGLCPHHAQAYVDEWAGGNRIICDFLHRKKEPVRLEHDHRVDDEFWAHTEGM